MKLGMSIGLLAAFTLMAGTATTWAEGAGGGAAEPKSSTQPKDAAPPADGPKSKGEKGSQAQEPKADPKSKDQSGQPRTKDSGPQTTEPKTKDTPPKTGETPTTPKSGDKTTQPKTGDTPKTGEKSSPQTTDPKSKDASPKTGQSPTTPDKSTAQPKTGDDAGGSGQKAGAGDKSGTQVNITTEQRTEIRQVIVASGNAPRVTNVNFDVSIGVAVPRTVKFAVLPPRVVEIYPAWRGYRYFIVEERIIIIDDGYRIVFIIES